MSKSTLKDATIALTYRCNARCRMCNIWQNGSDFDLAKDWLANLSPKLLYVNLSGGEPFLRADLPEIVGLVKKTCPKAQIIISSNGFNSRHVISVAKKILAVDSRIGIRISLDGLAEKHDQIRGVPGIFEEAVTTLAGLQKIGVKNLGIGFTIMEDNVSEINKVYDLSKKMGIQFSITAVQNSEIYFGKADNKINSLEQISRELDLIIKKQLRSWNIKKWLRAYFVHGLKHYLLTGQRLIQSGAGFDSCFIDPLGDIYPSNLANFKIGNLSQEKLASLWQKFDSQAPAIQKARAEEPWTICTLRSGLKKNWLKIGKWIVKNKIKL